jgi:glycosyltransferase involved in cell wall biosynthesis
MRFHVVSLPHTNTTEAFSACAYTAKVRNFCRMMKMKGHEVFLYAGAENDAPCDEHICCIFEAARSAAVGNGHYVEASFDYSLPHWRRFNDRAAKAIRARALPRDFVCVIAGLAHKQIADALPDLMTVEFGIGYGGTFSAYRIWESYAWMHLCYGAQRANDPTGVDGIWFDAVIPGYFDADKFEFSAEKDDYCLFVGRLTERKGFQIAAEVCQRLGKRLIIAGQGTPPAYGEYVGVIGPQERSRLMSRARALFVPTIYVEPFGNVAVEAQACGTPVISTDWGAMTETVEHGKTGFRCRTFAEFTAAVTDVAKLDPDYIRRRAIENYSLPVIAEKYDAHFRRLQSLYGEGWYARETERAGP